MARYKDVKDDLINKIDDGIYKRGGRIPSERVMSEAYGVSRMTLRQALNELENEGLLYREKGRGTFVTTPDLYQENMLSFTETLIARQMTPTTRILELSRVLHLKNISQMLGLHPDEPYYKIKRLRLGDNVPIALETVYIPRIYAEAIDRFDLTESIYGILGKHFGYEMIRSDCEIEACLANRLLSEQMDVKKNAALLKITGVTYCQGDRALFYEESYYRSELYKYHVEIMGQR